MEKIFTNGTKVEFRFTDCFGKESIHRGTIESTWGECYIIADDTINQRVYINCHNVSAL